MPNDLTWGDPEALQLTFACDADAPFRLVALTARGVALRATHAAPFFEITTVAAGHAPASSRLTHSQLGTALRYVSHRESVVDGLDVLEVTAEAPGLVATAVLRRVPGVAAVTSEVVVRAVERQVLRSVASWSCDPGATAGTGTGTAGPTGKESFARWSLLRGRNDWLGEGRWSSTPLREAGLVTLREDITGHDPRGAVGAVSTGSWSTGEQLPVAGLHAPDTALLWQIEHNGAWRWEVGEDIDGGSIALSGPTDLDHGWLCVLEPGEEFRSVPVTVAVGADTTAAADALTLSRRARRRAHPDNAAMPVVFNDYMNTLDGDPTTEKLLPLIDAAGAAGAEIFCIDAGWYDDSGVAGGWWSSVGAWQPSTVRFPDGLCEVIERIRARGLVPGLWLEPEVIGVDSPLAGELPDDAFLQRAGARIEEHERFHLDLRHPAARAHLDATVDRLIADFGIGFFKLDYNIDAGPGTDRDADSIGAGLLGHNRAYLAWLDGVLERHPTLVIESCSSGAMRQDWAVMSRLQMQSTSDQQDFRRYPPIAAAAPMMLLPEQAASWAYPQADMDDEEIAFCLVTGLLGRFYLSGYLNRMSDPQLALVHEAVAAAKRLRAPIAASLPRWPLGLPGWTDDAVALALRTEDEHLVSVWRRSGSDDVVLHVPELRGQDVDVSVVFPVALTAWPVEWEPVTARLTVRPTGSGPSARTFRLSLRTT
ncbi:alpha-galactosidase [Rathayibacter sp. PhB93]|uniref:glycoside hydrolase family 36 protein n=1 Tax=unclassified Rathayibacter TaxID=2609250 RepID=UPI000F4AE1C4|nr:MULTISPECIES: glycoside hydrolase family 36 protein [unclassified Rathayibacter]ROQ03694.1 alpha-galactosidase [Rathayibacter sp. PhB93]TDQ10718.1 alpha-galactosidase [Rathayibacter sp. PhB1]